MARNVNIDIVEDYGFAGEPSMFDSMLSDLLADNDKTYLDNANLALVGMGIAAATAASVLLLGTSSLVTVSAIAAIFFVSAWLVNPVVSGAQPKVEVDVKDEVRDKFRDWLDEQKNKVDNLFKDTFDKFKNKVKSIVEDVWRRITETEAYKRIKRVYDNISDKLTEWKKDVTDKMSEWRRTATDTIKDWSETPRQILNKLADDFKKSAEEVRDVSSEAVNKWAKDVQRWYNTTDFSKIKASDLKKFITEDPIYRDVSKFVESANNKISTKIGEFKTTLIEAKMYDTEQAKKLYEDAAKSYRDKAAAETSPSKKAALERIADSYEAKSKSLDSKLSDYATQESKVAGQYKIDVAKTRSSYAAARLTGAEYAFAVTETFGRAFEIAMYLMFIGEEFERYKDDPTAAGMRVAAKGAVITAMIGGLMKFVAGLSIVGSVTTWLSATGGAIGGLVGSVAIGTAAGTVVAWLLVLAAATAIFIGLDWVVKRLTGDSILGWVDRGVTWINDKAREHIPLVAWFEDKISGPAFGWAFKKTEQAWDYMKNTNPAEAALEGTAFVADTGNTIWGKIKSKAKSIWEGIKGWFKTDATTELSAGDKIIGQSTMINPADDNFGVPVDGTTYYSCLDVTTSMTASRYAVVTAMNTTYTGHNSTLTNTTQKYDRQNQKYLEDIKDLQTKIANLKAKIASTKNETKKYK